MKNFAIKRTITNSVNDNVFVEWYFCDTEAEREAWIRKEKEEQDKWNYHTDGATSFRDYDFRTYTKENLLRQNLSDLEGMSVETFFDLLKWFLDYQKPSICRACEHYSFRDSFSTDRNEWVRRENCGKNHFSWICDDQHKPVTECPHYKPVK